MPRLRQNERERAIGMLAVGITQVQVAYHFNVSRMTIVRLKTRLRDTGTTHDRSRSGRPSETTDGRARVYWRRNEQFSEACMQETDRFGGGGGLMVWGGITYQERTELKIIDGNLNATSNISRFIAIELNIFGTNLDEVSEMANIQQKHSPSSEQHFSGNGQHLQDFIRRLVDSMRRRSQAVINARGGHTRN
ncbi:Hypothetical predicted protein [Mytilus galloprovincialis]|uniref:Uncharacterized protein n=1 Tax=Mytilus galloprovincialis TaxID=29158 RepID=A0A8B6EHW5_MYTGA|nr:Hypothetical predicted protein [Mytilus galloprovincialis]